MSLRQFIADVMELPKAINAVNETIGGDGMTHTPGPWERHRDKNGRVSKIEGKGHRVCTFQPSDPNTNNDSALIEAAPDMLEALETIMDIRDKACRDIARAAIRKARGEV